MAFDDDQILQDYIARLLAVQDTRDALIDEADLQAAAHDLGLSERELARATAIAEAHRQRGKNFARHDAWNEAIDEFRQAMVLDPFDVPLLHELAVAHASRFEETHDPADREAAYTYAQRCTQLDPNHAPSFALISALGNNPKTNAATPPRRQAVVIAMAMVVLSLGGAIAFLLMDTTPPTTVTTSGGELEAQGATNTLESSNERDYQVPLQLARDQTDGFQLDVQRSQLSRYDTSFAYRLDATLLNETAELHRLQMHIDLLDAAGTPLVSKTFDAVADHHPPLRPGDTAPIGELIFEKQPPPAVEEARLSIKLIEREPAATAYTASPAVPLVWDIAQPDLALDVTERENSLRPNFRKHLHFLTFAVHNKGPRTVQRLRLEVKWLSANNEVITSKSTYAVPSSGPGLRAGATWVVRTIGSLPDNQVEDFDRYEVHVIEAE